MRALYEGLSDIQGKGEFLAQLLNMENADMKIISNLIQQYLPTFQGNMTGFEKIENVRNFLTELSLLIPYKYTINIIFRTEVGKYKNGNIKYCERTIIDNEDIDEKTGINIIDSSIGNI